MNQSDQIKRDYRSSSGRIAYGIAIGGGAGLAPLAPGTFGALEGVALYLVAAYIASTTFTLSHGAQLVLMIALNILVFAVGVWAAGRTCEISGLKDPQKVVIDEVSGQLIALTPLAFSFSIPGIIAAFVLFRLFDIFKPLAIRKLESLRGGFGVMADDALAGVYAAALVSIGLVLHLL